MNLTETEKSEFFSASLKNGPLAKKVMDEEVFCAFLDYSTYVARQGCKELKEGYIAASPYKGNCDYCRYGGMCGFNAEKRKVRTEPEIDPKKVAEIARTQRQKGEK